MNRAKPPLGRLDAIILGAAVALGSWGAVADPKRIESGLGLGATQAKFESERDEMRRMRPKDFGPPTTLVGRIGLARTALLNYVGHALPIVTIGAFLATFRRRAAWSRRSLRRTGVVTTFISGSFVAFALLNEYVLRRVARLQSGYTHNFFDSLWTDLGVELGLAVAALWSVMALGGVWRATPEGPDRLGRAVGFGWLVYVVLGDLLIHLIPFSYI